MTVETLITESGPFAAGGTTYYFTFQALSTDDVKTYVDDVLGAPVVTLNADQQASPGGRVKFASAATGEVLIRREVTLDQRTEYVVGSAFPAATHEAAIDRIVMQVQDLKSHADADVAAEAAARAAADAAEAVARSAADAAEAAARAAADAALIASGAAPANVGIAPVVATGQTTFRIVADWFGDVLNAIGVGADPTGAADSAPALQAALDTGRSLYFPPGTYRLDSTLNMNSVANHGQRVFGAGALSSQGTGSAKTIIKPGPGVTAAFLIDGSPFAHYLQNWSFEDFTVDMSDMADAATTTAFDQRFSWQGRYTGIQIIGDGVDKRGWICRNGAYVTLWDSCSARLIEATGVSDGDQATTLTFLNVQNYQYVLNYASAIKIMGGALQGGAGGDWVVPATGNIRIKCVHVTGLMVGGVDVEGNGTYIDIGASCSAFFSTGNQLVGFTGIITSGAGLSRPYIITDVPGLPAYFHQSSKDFQLWGEDATTVARLLSGGADKAYTLQLGRMVGEVGLGVEGDAGDSWAGTAGGDLAMGCGPANNVWLHTGGVPALKIDTNQEVTALGPFTLKKAIQFIRQNIVPGPDVDIDAATGSIFDVFVGGGAAFTVNKPTNARSGHRITISIRNETVSPLGAITWAAGAGGFKLSAWTQPAASFCRYIDFVYDGTYWFEVSRTPADVPL